MCHLAVEKALKGLLVERIRETPPKSHNLLYLMNLSHVQLAEDQVRFLSRLNLAGVTTRYPEELGKALKDYPFSAAIEYLENAREVVECLKRQAERETS